MAEIGRSLPGRGSSRQPAHPTPMTYAKVAAALVLITAVEVAVFYVESLRPAMVSIFLVLSGVKFVLVAMFYMHLKFDSRLFSGFFVGGLLLAAAVVVALLALFGSLLAAPRPKAEETAAASIPAERQTAGEVKASEQAAQKATGAPVGAATVQVSTVGDDLKFDKSKLSVKAGAEVVLQFVNNSGGLEHNWVLVKTGTKDKVAADGLKAGASNDWVPSGDDRVFASTKLLKPKGTGEVRFTAPSSGAYQFVCTYPGHAATMFGRFEVTK